MSFAPLNLQLWADRARASITTAQVRTIALAANQQAIEQFAAQAAPAIYFMQQTGRANDSTGSERITQLVDASVSVLMVTYRVGDPAGGKGVLALRELRTLLWNCLIGWQPSDAIEPVRLATYRDEDWKDAVTYGYDQFATRMFLRVP